MANSAWTEAISDGLGSVRGWLNSSQAFTDMNTFDPYGVPDSAVTGFGFTGEMTDDNGLVYLRARYYQPNIGMFASLDPFEGVHNRPMSVNGYSWVEGNVANWSDASGRCVDNLVTNNIKNNDRTFHSSTQPNGLYHPYQVSIFTTISMSMLGLDWETNQLIFRDSSLGTIANYYGYEVILTYDHFFDPVNTCNSYRRMQNEYEYIYVDGYLGAKPIPVSDLAPICIQGTGVMMLIRRDMQPFGITPIVANISFNYQPSDSETFHYAYIEGENRLMLDSQTLHYWDESIEVIAENMTYQPYSRIQVTTAQNRQSGSFQLNNIQAGQGDSGTCAINEMGECVAVFETQNPPPFAYLSDFANWIDRAWYLATNLIPLARNPNTDVFNADGHFRRITNPLNP